MTESKRQNWTWKDGWESFKKIIIRPDKSLAIQNELIKLNSRLTLKHGFIIDDKNRRSQIIMGFENGSMSIDFWENGICWHSEFLNDIKEVALCGYLWNDVRENSAAIERQMPAIRFPEKRKQIEISNQQYLKWHWDNLVQGENDLENELIGLLKKNSTITKLMTFRQLWDLGFSRYIGEYGESLKNDLLRAKLQGDTIEVRTEVMAQNDYGKGDKRCIGKGDAKAAYKLILDNLPPDLDWAEYQTLEQYIARTEKS